LVSYIPTLFALHAPPVLERAPNVPQQSAPSTPAVAQAANVDRAFPTTERRDLGPRVRNPGRDSRFTGNNVFANNARSHRVEQAITLAGAHDNLPRIIRAGVSVGVCVSYHGKGACFEGCIRDGSHSPLTAEEKVPFHEWCDVAFA
jgi:hypothetical protein